MALFLSKYINKVDKKGRVSVPASFRAELSDESFPGIIVRPSFVSEAIDACGRAALQELQRGVGRFNPFTEERAGFANAIFARSHPVPWDGEGRVIVPAELLSHAAITDYALFVGLGDTFQVWEPERYAEVEREAIELARQQRATLAVDTTRTGDSG
jgi:MraZ protein